MGVWIRWGTTALVFLATAATGDLVRVRYPEAYSHGFLVLSDLHGKALAHGELVQWVDRSAVQNQLTIRFDDGSLHEEATRFAQRQTSKLLSYRLVQRGPSFTASVDVEFERTGRYRARVRPRPDAEEETDEGYFDVPNDLSNGLTSTLLKNLMPAGSATAHVVTFRPKPLILELHLTPEGTDEFFVGSTGEKATRFLVQPRVSGMTGILASVTGRQPSALRMWIAQGPAPALVRVEGPLYVDGPPWRIELSAPRWSR
jgi:hypothetical protein